jgi:hypothetical protein
MCAWRAIGTFLLLFGAHLQGQPSAKWVLLPSTSAGGTVRAGTWQPTGANVADANNAISQISEHTAENWKNYRIRIDHPGTYFRQYVPALRDGKKVLWVKAFCDERPPADWRSRLVVVDDGATCYWQAWFDSTTKSMRT